MDSPAPWPPIFGSSGRWEQGHFNSSRAAHEVDASVPRSAPGGLVVGPLGPGRNLARLRRRARRTRQKERAGSTQSNRFDDFNTGIRRGTPPRLAR